MPGIARGFWPALLAGLLVASSALPARAQPWSGIITAPRAVDWSTAGVSGGIPARSTICQTLNPGATPAQIAAAFASAGCQNQTVLLTAGSYTINSPLILTASNVTLRGAGPTTILNVNVTTSSACHLGDVSVALCTNSGSLIGSDPNPPLDNTATWNCDDTGGLCAQGRTVFTFSGHANMVVGSTIWFDQLYEAADGYPVAGDIWVTNWGGGDTYARSGRAMAEGHIVTACGTSTSGAACTSNTITISRGLQMPHWRSNRSPGAYWGNTTTVLKNSGIENLTLDFTNQGNIPGFLFINCTNCWSKGVSYLYRVARVGDGRLLNVINGVQVSILDNYFYGYASADPISIYTASSYTMANSLVQNNIGHFSTNPFTQNSSSFGNVFAYNYVDAGTPAPPVVQSSLILHGVAGQNLIEGNSFRNFSADNIHSSHHFITVFRNHFHGTAHSPMATETRGAMTLYAVQRFFSLIGNVSGSSAWGAYEAIRSNGPCNPSGNALTVIFFFGWSGTNSTGCPATGDDANVGRTVMRWGNWDNVTSTNDNGTNDATGTRFVGAEVPSAIANFPNSVPVSQVLPASFYLAAQPSWWTTPFGTPKWPAVGPDVQSGNVNNGSVEPTGGHVDKIPARLCFENLGNHPSYPTSSPRVKLFASSNCYSAAGTTPPAAPSNLQVK